MLPFELTKDTPYLALSGELWSVFCEYFNINWPCYKGFLLYIYLYVMADSIFLPLMFLFSNISLRILDSSYCYGTRAPCLHPYGPNGQPLSKKLGLKRSCLLLFGPLYQALQYIPRNMHTVFALLCFVAVIHWLIFPYPPGLLHWHCGNLTIAPMPAKQPWWIWINTNRLILRGCFELNDLCLAAWINHLPYMLVHSPSNL